jgi:hypothetical protein
VSRGKQVRARKEKNQMVERPMRTLDEILDDIKENPKPLDQTLEALTPKERKEYEEAIELWITYGGN